MTTQMTIANVSLPSYLLEMGASSVLDNAVSGLSSGSMHPRISIKGSRFRIVEDGVEQTLNILSLSTVIVGANSALSKQYYEGAYDPDTASGPACFSDDGVAPDASATSPQNDRCATCPKAQWGSKISLQGKEVKACSDLKRLAVVSSDDMDGSIYELAITPAALTGFNKYAKDLKMRKIPIEAVKTLLGFDADASYPKLTFSFGGFLDRDSMMKAREIALGDDVKDVVRQRVAAVVVAAPQISAPKAQPAPVQEAPTKPAPAAKTKGFGAAPAEAAPVAAKTKGFGAAPAEVAPTEKVVNEAPKKAKPVTASVNITPAPAVDISDFEAELAEFSQSGVADDAEME